MSSKLEKQDKQRIGGREGVRRVYAIVQNAIFSHCCLRFQSALLPAEVIEHPRHQIYMTPKP